MKNILFSVLLIANLFAFLAQPKMQNGTYTPPADGDRYLKTIEESLNAHYAEFSKNGKTDSIIDALGFEPGEIPDFTDEEYCARLSKINELTPFHLDCNAITLSSIRFFAANRRSFCRVALGRAKLYFPMFEEKLAKNNMPIELKYLAVIESGLRPQVKSGAGALGLWQFMYRTGLSFGLEENSYIDERMDPEKATEAACRYLKQLFSIYNDWNLALAAYNAGPGNVNKAIRRSGGKKTYWEVRPFLPRETQGYVPNFISMCYLMTYHAEHNIIPADAVVNNYQLDTMCLNKGIHMNTISSLTSWDMEEIKALNPIYKTAYIPKTVERECISGPMMQISKLVGLEDSLYALEDKNYSHFVDPIKPIISDTTGVNGNVLVTSQIIVHRVKKGETMTTIARKYKTTTKEVMRLNKLRSARVANGQRLKIAVSTPTPKEVANGSDPGPEDGVVEKDTTELSAATKFDSYKVRKGDTAPKVAKKFGITQKELLRINGLKSAYFRVGQILKVPSGVLVKTPVVNKTPSDGGGSKPLLHTVVKGETLNTVSRKYGVAVAELKRINKLTSETVKIGQKIKLIDFGVTEESVVEEVEEENDTTAIVEATSTMHKVKSKESLNTIGKLYGVSPADIMKWNALKTTKLTVGQELKIIGGTQQQPLKPLVVQPKKKFYSVRSGETLAAIARKHSLTQAQLIKLNPGVKPDRLSIGQSIRVK